MTDTTTKCAHCGNDLPPSKGQTMKIVNPRIGFVGWYCDKEACREAGFAKACDFGDER